MMENFPLPYWSALVASLVVAVAMSLSVSYVQKLKIQLKESKADLERSAAEWAHAMDFLEDPMYLVDLDDQLMRANRAFFNQIGKTPDEALGCDVKTLIHLKPEKKLCPACAARAEKRDAFFTKEADDPTNPTGRPIEVTVRVVRDDIGKPIGIFQGLRDLSHLRQTEEALRKSQNRLANAQRIAHLGSWDWHINRDELLGSKEFSNIFGIPHSKDPVTLDVFIQRLPEMEQHRFRSVLSDAVFKGNAFSMDQTIFLKDGKQRIIHQEAEILFDSAGKAQTICGTAQDITERKLAEQALYEEKERAQVTLQSIGDAVITTTVNGNIEYANPAAEKLLQLNRTEIVNKNYAEILNITDNTTEKAPINPVARCLTDDENLIHEEQCTLISHNNSEHVVDITASPIRGRHGNLRGSVLIMHDITEMHSMSRLLNFQATHDELTGLINRREFEIRLQQALENARIDKQQHALIYLDLDNFKIVNDTCGHIAGDELLKQISELLKSTIRTTDTVARLGGDEFAVLLMGCQIIQAKQIAEQMQLAISEYNFQWNSRNFEVGLSAGITPITDNNHTSTELLSNADSACYVAKASGRNQIHIYDDNDIVVQQHRGEMQWVQKITEALAEDRFSLYFQEIRPLSTPDTNLMCYEVLVRMQDKNGDLIAPNVFIPAAERYQLMTAIDRWVINKAFDIIAEQNHNHERQWFFSINLSGQSLSEHGFLEYIEQQIHQHQANPSWICFEITETAAIRNLTYAKQFIIRLKQMGFSFALDDFGSGMSSFAYLRELHIDFLKIEGSFVKQIVENRIDYAMVSSINQIGQLMGIRTIAEYVENDKILDMLKGLNVDFGQGYGIDKPKPLSDFQLEAKQRQVS